MPVHRTVAESLTFVADPIKGSRFIASVSPSATEGEAMEHIRSVQADSPDASHHCWAWLLHDDHSRSWDDGEPRGSAGRPILAQLQGHGLVDLVVVVSRWFGGTKLGVGGLIRAYGGTAGKALDRATVIEVATRCELLIEHDYDDTGAIQVVIAAFEIRVVSTAWGAREQLTLEVDEDRLTEVMTALRDRTRGRVSFLPSGGG